MLSKKVALLRGINVGGKNPLKMAELRDLLARANLKDVKTYIQSGNIIFNSSISQSALERLIKEQIAKEFGYEVSVLVRAQNFLEKAIAQNPLDPCDETKLHLTMLNRKPSVSKIDSFESQNFGDDHFKIVGDLVYVCCPSGYGKTKLTNGFFEKNLGVDATTRNWKTISKLASF